MTARTLFTLVLLLCSITVSAAERQPGAGTLSHEEVLRLGERIYREGVLPSGEPVEALIRGDVSVPGTAFTCISCHLRSGLGSYEGGVVTPPTNGEKLFKPCDGAFPGNYIDRPMVYSAQVRPAYTDETLANALSDGFSPTGRKLDPVMPRYLLDDADMVLLIAYLKSLSAQPSPGVMGRSTLRFATVVTDDVPPAERDAVVRQLQNFFGMQNNPAKYTERTAKAKGMSPEEFNPFYLELTLSVWELKGEPETWRSQLEEYNRKEPAFALLGGITTKEWTPVHDFSEEHRIPCVFPITDLPVVTGTDWYTMYYSKGYYQEGEAAARYLASRADVAPKETVVQVFQDTGEGRAFSTGFLDTWHKLGRRPPVNHVLPAHEKVTPEYLRQLTDKNKPSVMLLWAGPEALPALEAAATGKSRPGMVFVSANLLKQDIWTLPEGIRQGIYITYPYRLPQEKVSNKIKLRTPLRTPDRKVLSTERNITARMTSLTRLLSNVFMMIRQDFYRDYFLDVIGMTEEQDYPDAERLSFGPGQRYAMKGCYIVQVSEGAHPELVQKSDWVLH
jgi:Periplasmic binding protein